MAGGRFGLLTDREQRVLRLLAGGHAVKSAAAEEGTSENAANELLRSACRKLGTGSSREAARLFAAHENVQKNRDEKSGLFLSVSAARLSWLSSKGIIAMSATALAVSAILLLALDRAGPGAAASDGSPRVTRTSPANGAAISPGPFTL